MPRDGRAAQSHDRSRQPVPRLGIMGDAVQEFVGPLVDMVVNEMRQRAVNHQGTKPQRNQDQPGPEQHGFGCRAARSKSTDMRGMSSPATIAAGTAAMGGKG